MKKEVSYWREREFIDDLINQLPAAIFWKNIHSVFLGCNKHFADMAKLSSTKDIIGKTDYDLPWGKYEGDSYRKDDQEVIKSKQPKLGIEETQTLSNGKVITLLTNKIPLFSKKTVVGILGIFHDITSRKEMEISLEKAKNQAESANRAKTEFIANMSHDIRTPLSGVVGMAQLLEESVENAEQKQFARWLRESGEQLLGMLNGILDVVSADNVSENDTREEVFNLYSCLEEIVRLERLTTTLKGIGLEITFDKKVPEYIVGDRTKIHRILLNLVGNAIKFTEKGQVGIDVKLSENKEGKSTLHFSVSDTGIGIPPEHQDKVFDRFFRASPSYKGIYAGHGIGLHIVQSYVKLLGGEITLSSKEGVGTTIFVDLPLKTPNTQQIAQLSPIPEQFNRPVAETDIITSKNIPHLLLVEDNNVALKVLESVVAKAGCHFHSAMNGEEALLLAKKYDFDLIITDIGLPGMLGDEFTIQFRAWEKSNHKKQVPIVGLTAHGEKNTKQNYLQCGMDSIYTKPINLSVLQEILKQFTQVSNDSSDTQDIQSDASEKLGVGLPNTEKELFELNKFSLFDLENAISKTGSEKVLKDILQILVTHEIPSGITALQKAHSENNWMEVEKLAHKMKGGAVYCGTLRMQHACQYLERYQKAGHSELLEKLYTQLIKVLNETQKHLKLWLGEDK